MKKPDLSKLDKLEHEIRKELPFYIEDEAARLDAIEQGLESDPRYTEPPDPPAIRKMYRRPGRRLAAMTAAVLAVLVLCTISVAAIHWEEIIAFFAQQWETHTTIGSSPTDSGEAVPQVWDIYYMPTWLPDGYYPDTISPHKTYTELFFYNEAGNLLVLSQGNTDFRIEIDTEWKAPEEVEINGGPGVIAERDGIVKLAWGTGPQFLLAGELSREDMIRIAESIEPPPEIMVEEGTAK